MNHRLHSLWKDNRYFILLLLLMFVFRSSIADWNTVPSGSMRPTILEGDRIFVNKMAYDIRVPFTHISLYKIDDPSRGDIVIFDSNVSDKRLVKRVIGVPGDTVAMTNNMVYINGQPQQYEEVSADSSGERMTEYLSGAEHFIQIKKHGSPLSSFPPVTVPEAYYLVLGDNRDNSADSRVIGFVPRDEIVGRSRSVVMSLDYDNYYIPRKDRFFHAL